MMRVRGTRRNKITEAIRNAGYLKEYSEKQNNVRKRSSKEHLELDLCKLAENMGMDNKVKQRNFAKNFRETGGIPMKIAKVVIAFLNENHDSQLKIRFDDY